MKRSHQVLAVLFCLSLAIVLSCGEDETTNPPVTALTVTVAASPASPTTGGTVSLTAQVTPSGVYSYTWSSAAGALAHADSSVATWTAPDADGTYEVQVVVHDVANAATAKASLAVADYVPAVNPHYLGSEACSSCHAATYASWSHTGHAAALEALVGYGQGENAFCLPCHTVGYNPGTANGGYDEQKVARLGHVGCENCHAPGSEHVTNPTGGLPIFVTADRCGACHNGEHHPTYDEWQASPHSGVVVEAAVRGSTQGSCAKCHNGEWASQYLDDPTMTFTGAPVDTLPIFCLVCHDPHGNGNKANLRNAVNDIALPDGTHPEAGAGRLCIACHNGRRTPTNIESQIANGTGHFGPHPSNQGDMLAGVGAYEGVNPSFEFRSSKHVSIQDGCLNCHTHHLTSELPYYTGHNFTPSKEACQECHGPITDYEDILAKDDYDGDGTVEGVQNEVRGLEDLLTQAIIENSRDETRQAEIEAALLAGTWEAAIGDTSLTSIDQRKAGYNLFFVEQDKSSGVHNATYTIQLLQQSIRLLNPLALGPARILVD